MRSLINNRLLLPAVSGVGLWLAFPPLPAGFLGWIALTPLLISLRKAQSAGEAIRIGVIFGLAFNLTSLHFIAFNSGAPPFLAVSSMIGMALILTLFGPVFALPQYLAFRKWGDWGLAAAPFFWGTMEYLRSLGEIGFPWNITPLTQANYLTVIQMASITGIWGISFWVAGANALFYRFLNGGRIWIVPFIIWIALPFGLGFLYLKNAPQPYDHIKIGLVQGNIDPAEKWSNGLYHSLNIYERLSAELDSLHLLVWPETAVPSNLRHQIRPQLFLWRLADSLGYPVFTGALDSGFDERGIEYNYNSAFLIKPGFHSLEQYNKIQPVPFGERVPFQKLFPILGKLNFGQAEFTPGDEHHIFQLERASFGAMICFESIFPRLSRRYIRDGADFLVNITNDGWYGKTSEPYQHALLTRFRAVETGRSLVRAANTGISSMIDAQGRIIVQSPLEVEAVLEAELPLYDGSTFYMKYGDVFAIVISMVSLLILMVCLLPERFFRNAGALLIFSLILSIFFSDSYASNRFMTLSNSQVRSISLAGPAAMLGYPGDTPENPAGFCQYRSSSKFRLNIYLNPLGAGVALGGLLEGSDTDTQIDEQDIVIPLLILVKGFAASYRALNFGVVFGEQYPPGERNERFFHYFPLFDNYYNRVFIQLDLDRRIAIGVSAQLYSIDYKTDRVGFTYGVILKPGKLNVGVFYNIIPDKYKEVFHPVKRLAQDTVNAGVSWEMLPDLKCYFDLRNISEEGREAFLEPHTGAELVLFKHIALRGGYYLENGEKGGFSLGLGLWDLNQNRAFEDRLSHREFILAYGFSHLPDKNNLHSVSMFFNFK